MKLSNAIIEGGITGATTLTLLQEALHKIDHNAPRPFLHKSGIIKELKKSIDKPGRSSSKLYIKLATELLTNVASFGLVGLGKKKNVILRGTLLGAAAGLGSVFLQDDDEEKDNNKHRNNNHNIISNSSDVNDVLVTSNNRNDLKKKLLTVALYTAGGVLAGVAIKQLNKKNKKSKIKNKLTKIVNGKNRKLNKS